jgi:hypothetical protein
MDNVKLTEYVRFLGALGVARRAVELGRGHVDILINNEENSSSLHPEFWYRNIEQHER